MLLLALVFAICSVPAFSQPVIFDYRAEDRDFLNYYYIWNQFDSSVVMYEFGEVTFVNTSRHNIPLSKIVKDGQQIQGVGTQGVSTDLELIARTEDFNVPSEGEIQWFGRLQSFRTPCGRLSGGHKDEPNRPSQSWGIVDRTEFVVQLVDAQSGTVIATLDSVGVQPTGAGTSTVDTRYGTNVERVKRSFAIPASYTGTKVYVRISPRRYGPTPFGLTISRYRSWINLSAEYDSTGTTQIPLTQTEVLRDQWFTELIIYCDSVKQQTGWLPELQGISFAKESHLAIFHSKYFTPAVDINGDTVWNEIHTTPISKRSAGNTRIVGAVDVAPLARITSIAPHPVVSENISFTLLVGMDMNARLELISLDGKQVGNLWNGSLRVGRLNLTVPIPKEIPNGSYILVLYGEPGGRITQEPLIITR